MTKLAHLTLTAALMGSLVFPALAQSSTTSSVPMQPPVKVLPGLHHRAAGYSNHVHRVADAVRVPAVTSGSLPGVPMAAPSKSVAVDGKAAAASLAPAARSSTGTQSQDTIMDSKAAATPTAPAAKSAAVVPAPTLSAAPRSSGTATTSPALPRQQ